MILERFFTAGLAQVAYAVGDEVDGVAAVIDPRRDVDAYLAWAAEHGLRIAAVLESHVHADFVSGARELAAATGTPIYAGRRGDQAFPHRPLDDGEEVAVGRLRLRALWTPGHIPEHLAYLLIDPAAGPHPVALFSGDALFVGEVGRPDLLGGGETRRLAEQLHHTVVERLGRLDDAVVVYPGHTAGSACGKKIGDAPQTTIGREKRANYAFQAPDQDAFVRMVLDGLPPAPTYYSVLKGVNTTGPALLRELPTGEALAASEVAARQTAGALVVDARTPEAFGAGHVPGAVSVGLGPNFAAWMGWLAPYDRDLVLVLDDDARFAEALIELRRIGLDRPLGFLDGGIAAWRSSGRPVALLPQTSVHDLATRLASPETGLVVLDVRSDEEWAAGHIRGAVHRFAGELAQGEAAPTIGAREVAVICGSGYRSSLAASLGQARGADHAVNVGGGMAAWHAARLPTTAETAPPTLPRPGAESESGAERETPEIDVGGAARARDGGAQLVDVREPAEWDEGHVPGAVHLPLPALPSRTAELDRSRPVITLCQSGRRSRDAADLLLGAGFADVRSMAGGMVAWRTADLPVER